MNRAAPPLDFGPRNPFCPPPLDAALGGQVSPEFQWQAARMPPLSRSLLLFGDDPGSVDPAELVNELRLDLSTAEDVRRALGARGDEAVLRSPAVLPPAACEALRNAVSTESQQKADTVDGAPDHQLNLSREELESAIGPEAAAALWSLPASFLGEAADAALTSDVEIFVRRYTPATRPRGALDADETVRDLPREGPCAECDCTTRREGVPEGVPRAPPKRRCGQPWRSPNGGRTARYEKLRQGEADGERSAEKAMV